MSNLIVNIRFFDWHFQVDDTWRPSVSRNSYHRENGWPDGRVRIHQWFGYHS
jgi:hypothetical protein